MGFKIALIGSQELGLIFGGPSSEHSVHLSICAVVFGLCPLQGSLSPVCPLAVSRVAPARGRQGQALLGSQAIPIIPALQGSNLPDSLFNYSGFYCGNDRNQGATLNFY